MSKAEQKIKRVLTALRDHEEPDRVPLTDFYWSGFLSNWKKAFNLPEETDIYEYYDLDVKVISPNMDPKVESCVILEKTPDYVVFKSGFGCTVKKMFDAPMPMFLDFSVKSAEELLNFTFDDPRDDRRYFEKRCDIINCGDSFGTLPSFAEDIERNKDKFCLFGSICEPYETMWRIRGTEGLLLDLAMHPEKIKAFAQKVTDFMLGIAEREIELAPLTGMVIWGDVAYDKGMFFSPKLWREIFFPCVKRLCDFIHSKGLITIYHGCGRSLEIFEDLIEAGVDVYNPLEAKAGMDPVMLKKRYGDRISFFGGIDTRLLGEGNWEEVEKEVLYKLQAAKGGGYMPASDHSVASNVDPVIYDKLIGLLKDKGRYPLSV
ncbi:uroporphyrinogen decarboxylase family protein [Thermatribacter velox]|uniref:Uroporphyrinogen decarboxylase family protein n=1 Tax=Thermatribacter velox TaxID=3039681 RepID=A0ABZ2YG26_9BACT